MSSPAKADLIFELASEEIPAAYQAALVSQWETKSRKLFSDALAEFESIKVGATPRRIWLYVSKLAEKQKSEKEQLLGPARPVCFDEKGAPTPALVGFARKAGIEPLQINFIKGAKGEQAVAEITKGGKNIRDIIPGIVKELLTGLRFPRVMRWASFDYEYPRPLLGVYIQYGNEVLTPEAETLSLPVKARAAVSGHFILHKGEVQLSSANVYFSELEKAKVIADPEKRKALIKQALEEAAAKVQLNIVEDEDLLNEVNYLTEYPGVVMGEYPEEYLALPEAVIISEMKEHQRYFAARDKSKKLSRYFFIVSNGEVSDSKAYAKIKAGNERVLKARLSDGNFFFTEDRKTRLRERIADLQKIVFQEGLGSMADKQERLQKISAQIVNLAHLQAKPDMAALQKAAALCKADLTTQLVYEFDHLQGEIGAVYARYDGESESVCTAIAEHYMPRNQNDSYPSSAEGIVLSVADKLDNIMAGYLTGKQPTSSQDPFGLRRQSIYVIEIFMQNSVRVDLCELLNSIRGFYPPALLTAYEKEQKNPDIGAEITEFFRGRLASIFEKDGFEKKYIRSALYAEGNDLYDLYTRLTALKKIASENTTGFADLMTAFKRMANITESAKGNAVISEKLFESEYETNVLKSAKEISAALAQSGQVDYAKVFALLAASKPVVDAFFDNVMVNHSDEKIKNNRIALLSEFVKAVKAILDLNQLK